MNEPLLIKLEHPDEETARILAAANTHPVRVECDVHRQLLAKVRARRRLAMRDRTKNNVTKK